MFGQPFTPADDAAVILGQAVCSFSGISASATGLDLGFSSFTGLCAFASATRGCGKKADATVVELLLVRANEASATAPPVAPGVYTISTTTPPPDAQGNVVVASARATKTDATCGAGFFITISNLSFSPLGLHAPPGATITVINDDGIAHSVTSEASPNAFTFGSVAGISFDTGPFTGTRSIQLPSNAPNGTVVPYFCTVHKGAENTPNGAITVNSSAQPNRFSAATSTATSGTIRIDAVTTARVTGSADVTFQDGSHVAGTFDIPVCTFTTDVCTALAAGSCSNPACVP